MSNIVKRPDGNWGDRQVRGVVLIIGFALAWVSGFLTGHGTR